jgi:hypothetical protein
MVAVIADGGLGISGTGGLRISGTGGMVTRAVVVMTMAVRRLGACRRPWSEPNPPAARLAGQRRIFGEGDGDPLSRSLRARRRGGGRRREARRNAARRTAGEDGRQQYESECPLDT